MKMRTIALTLAGALIAGCSGSNSALPVISGALRQAQGDTRGGDTSGGTAVDALVRVRIPHRGGRRHDMHPSTISAFTRSLTIAVNAAKAQTFNATPSSPGCTIGSAGTTCTFAVRAPAGTDTFTVTTYAGVNATGIALDRGIVAKVPIAKGKANHVAVSLGPVVTTTADSGPGSLRYAIASANDGDTITFLLAKGSTITLKSVITLTSNVTIAGPGSTSVAISGGGVSQIFDVVGTATISGLTLAHGKAALSSSPGGAIQNAGTLALASDAIGSSTSIEAIARVRRNVRPLRTRRLHPHSCAGMTYVEGGGVYNNGALTVSHTTFAGNGVRSSVVTCVQGEGGAIYNDVDGSLSSTGDTYTGNFAAAGGAVYNAGAGAATFTGDAFTGNYGCNATSGCPTSGCSATSCTSYAVGEGGAIYDGGTGVTVAASTFANNVVGGKTTGSVGQGGAIYLDSDVPSITASTFTGNLAGGGTASCSGGAGGAIFSNNAFEIDNDTFKDNAAIGDANATGGAVAGADSITGTSDAFTGNVASSSGGACSAHSTGAGGGVYSAADVVTFASSTFASNSAVGGYAAAAGALGGDNGIVNKCTFTSNSVLATGAGAAQAQGGGGAVAFGSFGKIGGSTFTSNTATVESSVAQAIFGGAAAVSGGAFYSNGNTFTSNAVVEKTAASSALGGAVAAINGELVSTGDTFSSNSARGVLAAAGGAIYATSGAQINNATVTSNTASSSESTGGGIALGPPATLTHVIATKNVSSGTTYGTGGALFDAAGTSISDSTFSQNSATSAGGGIFSTQANETMIASSVTGNVVVKANLPGMGGGGIFAEGGVDVVYSTVAGNTLTVGGAGPDGGAGIFNSGGALVYESTISGNTLLGTASLSGGGGIFSNSGLIALNDTISNNRSSLDGGGYENADGTTNELMNVTLFANEAQGQGGNVFNLSTGALTFTNSIFGGGGAAVGPDVYNLGSITSGDYNVEQTATAGTAIGGTTTHDLIADPKLLALSNNGGPTFTNADQASSPGRARIPYSGSSCGGVGVTTDQRNYTRGAGGRCDAGAYEYAGVVTAVAHRPSVIKHAFRRRAAHGLGVRLPHVAPSKLDIPM